MGLFGRARRGPCTRPAQLLRRQRLSWARGRRMSAREHARCPAVGSHVCMTASHLYVSNFSTSLLMGPDPENKEKLFLSLRCLEVRHPPTSCPCRRGDPLLAVQVCGGRGQGDRPAWWRPGPGRETAARVPARLGSCGCPSGEAACSGLPRLRSAGPPVSLDGRGTGSRAKSPSWAESCCGQDGASELPLILMAPAGAATPSLWADSCVARLTRGI